MKSLICFLALVLILCGCWPEKEAPTPNYGLDLADIGNHAYRVDVNNNVPALGRVLFYDVRLSETNDISCGSCHKQKSGFADNQVFSKGLLGNITKRNTMGIHNNGGSLFWDGRETDLRKMVIQPILNQSEMGVKSMKALADELNELPYYRDLVQKAYNIDKLSEPLISDALRWFVKSIQPNNSRFDQHLLVDPVFMPGVPHKPSPFLSDKEMEGMKLFLEKYNCNACHNLQNKPSPIPMPVYGSNSNSNAPPNPNAVFQEFFVNIGLDAVAVDRGRQGVTNMQQDAGKFRVPSLRNIAMTAPYMHDGRFATLSDVIDHYANGVKPSPNVDAKLMNFPPGTPRTFVITDTEREALIAFLGTLTDQSVLTDPKWSNPFPEGRRHR